MIDLGTGHPAVHTTRREPVAPPTPAEDPISPVENAVASGVVDSPFTAESAAPAGAAYGTIDPLRVAGIDLGTGGGAPTPALSLTIDEANYLVEKHDIDQLPVVLDVFPRYDTEDARDEVYRAAADALESRGLARYGKAIPDLAQWLQVVARPRWEIALRWHIDGVVSRLCLSRGDDFSVLTLRAGDTIVVQDSGPDSLAAVMGAIGAVAPMQFGTINAPTDQLAEALNDAATTASLAARLDRLGAGPDDAAAVARAMSGCTTFTEIVGIIYGNGNYDPIDGPVTVFDTEFGRIIGTSSTSAHGVAWSSLAPGTSARFRQALESLIDRLS